MIDDAAERFREAYGIEDLTDPSAISQVFQTVLVTVRATLLTLSCPGDRRFGCHIGIDLRVWPNHLHSDRYG
jgi:hypothetical protein